MDDLDSVSSKKGKVDTRNNWITFMFKCKCGYFCFGKQSHIDACIIAFKEFEKHGFEFREIGFGGNHVHFQTNIPKRYSVEAAETMLKSRSAMRIFEQPPGFRKRYPWGSFWSGYEHHQSTGLQNIDESAEYIRDQQEHHNVKVIDDIQTRINAY
ncbi:MAG: transposase [archaeon]